MGDTFLELAKAQRVTRPLDYNMKNGGTGVGQATLPDAAFGPPGRLNPKTGVSEEGDTNVSVIVAGGLKGFSLQETLGAPEAAAQALIRLFLAPPGSGRSIALLSATSRDDGLYQLEYEIDRNVARSTISNTTDDTLATTSNVVTNKPILRAISVIASAGAGTKLITLTVTAPKQSWETDPVQKAKYERMASSFHTTT